MRALLIISFCLLPIISLANKSVGLKAPDFNFQVGESYYSSPVYFGGNIGFYPYQKGFNALLNPILGFRVSRRLHMGISAGLTYNYEKLDPLPTDPSNPLYDYNAFNYDVSIFSRYFLFYRFFAHIEPNLISVKNTQSIVYNAQDQSFTETFDRVWVPAGLIGIGYAQPLGAQSILVLTALYDVVQDENSPYQKYPFIRGGFNLGF